MQRTRRRRMQTAVVTAFAVALAAGCSGGGGGTAAGDGNLRIAVWTASEDHLDLLNGIGKEFKADHPEVKSIKFESLDPVDYTTALSTQLASGNPPDLGWILETNGADFIEADTLVDMAPEMKAASGYEADDLEPALLSQWKRGDALYAYPFSSSPFAVFYNADALAKAKADDPAKLAADGKWTWDALAEAAKKVTDAKSARYGLLVHEFDYKNWDRLYPVMSAYGAAPWTDRGTCGFPDPKMTEAVDFVRSMAFDDHSTPAPGEKSDFFSGESAMFISQVSKIGPLADVKWKWDAAPLPSGPAGADQVIGQAGLGVFAKGKNLDLAKEFFLYATNKENAAKLAQFFPPPRTSLLNAKTLARSNPLLSEEQLQNITIESLKTGKVRPGHTQYAKLAEQTRAALDPAWEPDADTDRVLAGVCEAIEPLLEPGS
ncbi:extracellular solute-binding protein [Streptomyces sp. PSKA54]|uniref:Extracellular solute-binding protein n=1 Tax=Streptomyces himalayensis subsp. aureolus TaxID=2758039 RepID=A0A7W2D2W9_9ACTN|nr:extracellular solute-binding protein [Streptomyces himalayensis]MBA4863779.1 extracellular solute-binding protein [Streptomyces himalayensis subsp. aureolus]